MNRSGFASRCTDLAAQIAIGAALVASLMARPARAEIIAPAPPAGVFAAGDTAAPDVVGYTGWQRESRPTR